MQCNLNRSHILADLGAVGRKPVSVTSEPNLCPLPAKLWGCRDCGHLQKVPDHEEMGVIDALYAAYDPHSLSGGNEQMVFPPNMPSRPRSYHALEQCLPLLPQKGRLLDVGTGNGAVLKSAAILLPKWRLHASDIADT